jgi:serine protease AprX
VAEEKRKNPGASTEGQSRKDFDPKNLWNSIIAIPLQQRIDTGDADPIPVVIDLNLDCRGGRKAAKEKVKRLIRSLNEPYDEGKNAISDQYVFATLRGETIRELVVQDQTQAFQDQDTTSVEKGPTLPGPGQVRRTGRVQVTHTASGQRRVGREECAIHRVWPDFEIRANINRSISTVKADAAHKSFAAFGKDVVWAVLDSGVEEHQHFRLYNNLTLQPPLEHRDFSGSAGQPLPSGEPPKNVALQDPHGHGTHVAGIIAGMLETSNTADGKVVATVSTVLAEDNQQTQHTYETLPAIWGMAPQCKLLSLRVLDDNGSGQVSNLIAAINYIQEINGYGRRILVHGVNMSLGYDFDPEWFACGQSPLCVEVNRLVRSGVVVVVSAGNSGYVIKQGMNQSVFAAGEQLTINDPGNADLAITVGSTHRDSPHTYGVSYFSSKGPTGDGRPKPDILAPGEKILSCSAASKRPPAEDVGTFENEALAAHSNSNFQWYVQDSGTSMAAAHVSGVIAAFLSIRGEFIGRPEDVKRVFLDSATDLGRERYFQGAGLIDLMRAIQAV